ncbi:ABC transporter substrate-binding protein, partial [bacterium]|nr:ABC transporter substrate-binding protein [bacterium]
MKKLTKVFALLIVLSLVVAVFAGCKPKNTYVGADTLVVGYSRFSGKFSPFFATTAYDQDVAGMTAVGLISTDREGNVVYKGIEGETRAYNGTNYTYTGLSDVTETINSDGTVDYNIKLRKGVKFSDGKELTVDDVLFSIYVYCDPAYTGSTTFSALPIIGMEEYRANMSPLTSVIAAAGRDGSSELFTAEQRDAYWAAFDAALPDLGEDITKYVMAKYTSYAPAYFGMEEDALKADEKLYVAFGMTMWGFGGKNEDGTFTTSDGKNFDLTTSFPTYEDYGAAIYAAYGDDPASIEKEKANDAFASFIEKKLGDKADELSKAVQVGESAANISGIVKVNDYELNIKMSKFDAVAIYQLGITVSPLHYYGDASKLDVANNSFGFTKGDLTSVKAKTSNPMGAGPYKFQSYENGVVTFEKSDYYFKGAPKIKYIKFQETDDADKVPGVTSGLFDVTDPSFNDSAVSASKKANSNGEITGNIVTTSTVDNLGYGYIGANATTVCVAGDPKSDASKNLRKAFATLFAVNRDKNIQSYYHERASIIQYPISNTSWAAPKPNDAGYELAYSKDVDGNQIYTSTMSLEEKTAAALQAAIGFFKAAGYTWDDAAGKFTAAPEGAKFTYEVIVPGDGIGDHPAYGILTDAKEQLATIGFTLEINDPSDSNILWDALDAGTQEFWTAAWGAAVDPDMYQVYHSSNVVGVEGSSESNHYRIQDDTLDQLIMDARVSADHAYRKGVYKQCLDIIMDWGVEIPT